MNNDALREFMENHGPVTIVNGEIQECDWDFMMDELDELISSAGSLRDALDSMNDKERIEWLEKHNLAFHDDDC